MAFCHGVTGGNKELPAGFLNTKHFGFGGFSRFCGRKSAAAAGDFGAGGCSNDIAALLADIEFHFFHIAFLAFFFIDLAGEQDADIRTEDGGERRQQGNIGAAVAALPF